MHIPDRFLFSGSRAISLSGMCFTPAMIRSCNAPSVMATSSASGLFIAAGRLLGARPSPAIPGKLPWPDQTFLSKSDQIRTSGHAQRFLHQLVIFRIAGTGSMPAAAPCDADFSPHRPAASSADPVRYSTYRSIPLPESDKNPAPAPAYSQDHVRNHASSTASFMVHPGCDDMRYGTRYWFCPQASDSSSCNVPKSFIYTACSGFPIIASTGSETCSGATFSCPLTWYFTSSRKKII